MVDNHYENPRLAEIYDLDSGWSADREFYLSLAGTPPQAILDLGCGTGLLCDAYADKGHRVTGVDPSATMLDVARRKPNGANVEWVQASAQTYRSDERFDLIIMTGHAFQVLLDDTDIEAAIQVMHTHLKVGGTVVFESRNPCVDWATRWNYEMILDAHDGPVHERRRFLSMTNERMKFELQYHFADQLLLSHSELRFCSREAIENHLVQGGFSVDKIIGDWHGAPFEERTSEEMIFVARRKQA